MKKKQKYYLKDIHFIMVQLKNLNNIDMLRELPFYKELILAKTSKAFRGYASSYINEIIDLKGPSV